MTYHQLIKQAPVVRGHRLLKAHEPAQAGDRFCYLSLMSHLPANIRRRPSKHYLPLVDDHGCIRLGCNWRQSRAVFLENGGTDFDGLIYRPIRK